MDLLQTLKTRDGSIVVVDDDLAPPDLRHLPPDDLTRFFEYLENDQGARARVAQLLDMDAASAPGNLVSKAEQQASQLWALYIQDETAYADLAHLFTTVKLQHAGDTQKLNLLLDFCRKELGVTPRTFVSLQEAAESLGDCVIAFVDFYLTSGIAVADAIAQHKAHKDSYRKGYKHQDEEWPKIVFLVSSKVPAREELQQFRLETGLRSAFFIPMRKGDLTEGHLQLKMKSWATRYAATAELSRYLTVMSEAVKRSADAVDRDLDRLELQDLAMLDAIKLSAERESLQAYLTWLLSETLASKVRSSEGLQKSLLPKSEALWPLDGKLMPHSVLFELFSDIAISPTSATEGTPAFGDVYAAKLPSGETSRNLLLVISPACDLIRCDPNDPVLCVEGEVTKADASMASLLQKKTLFGKGSHVIRYRSTNGSEFAHITWKVKKGLKTLPVNALASQYKKTARLSELFAQEVKELALADASRIGVPVDPMFAVAGKVEVRVNFTLANGEEPVRLAMDLSDKDFISAVITKGRVDSNKSEPQEILVFTDQFSTWLLQEFFPAVRAKTTRQIAKLMPIEDFFLQWQTWHVVLSSPSKYECNGALLFRHGSGDGSADCPSNKMEIIVSEH